MSFLYSAFRFDRASSFWIYVAYALLVVLLTVWAYAPGLNGGFLFDDQPNLSSLGAQGGVRDWDTLYAWLQSGYSGPTKRPVALLSFLLDGQNWPAPAWPFKRTNLILHLLCGFLAALCSAGFLRALDRPAKITCCTALVSASFWLLHPLFASTTLYVVQRMAQLSALFVLAGLAGYLHGRALLGQDRCRAGYAWMSASLVIGATLATLSKENGALLPLLVLVTEWILAGQKAPGKISDTQKRIGEAVKPHPVWASIFLFLPSLVILGYLVGQVDCSPNPWPGRPFNQTERLFTEARVLWDYLGQLWLPRIETRGLFQDDYVLSTGLLTPLSTLFAVLGLAGLLLAGLALRRRYPLASLAILFFLAGHLVESSVIGLELYFEHRNYLPAAFMFLPLADGIIRISPRLGPLLPKVFALGLCALLAFLLHQRSLLWSDTEKLQLYWAVHQPDSARAQDAIAVYLAGQGRTGEALRHLDGALNRMPNSSLLSLRRLLLQMEQGRAEPKDFLSLANIFRTSQIDAQTVHGMNVLLEQVRNDPSQTTYLQGVHAILDALKANPHFAQSPLPRYIPLYQGLLALSQNHLDQARFWLNDAMRQAEHPGIALNILAQLASAKQYQMALDFVPLAYMLLEAQPDRKLRLPRTTYLEALARIENTLQDDLNKQRQGVP